MNTWLFLGVAILSEVIATSGLKSSDGFTRLGPSLVAIIGYVIAFYFLSITLQSMPVGVAYGIWAGLGMVLIAIIGWLVYGQTLDVYKIAGLTLIVVGVFVINCSSSE